jgi:hypothetical protein
VHVVPKGGHRLVDMLGTPIEKHNHQDQATDAAITYLRTHGGGELIVHDSAGHAPRPKPSRHACVKTHRMRVDIGGSSAGSSVKTDKGLHQWGR